MPKYATQFVVHSDNGPKDGMVVATLYKDDKYVRTFRQVEGGLEVLKGDKRISFYKTPNPIGLIVRLIQEETSFE